jgi:thiol-disulfide isomerase/thioredoxin
MKDPKTLILLVLAVFILGIVAYWGRSEVPQGQTTAALDESLSPVITPINSTSLKELVRSRQAKVTIVNMWAAFCMPCREEFPYFLRLHQEYKEKGLDLIFVTLDFPSEIEDARQFLVEQGVSFETFIKAEKDDTFIRQMHQDWTGVLPTTFIYDEKGELLHFLPQPLTYSELKEKIGGLL